MPLTLTVTEGVLRSGTEQSLFKKLSELMLDCHGILGNKVMTPNVVGSIHLVPENLTFTGGDCNKVAFVEWKVPNFVFSNREAQLRYVKEATELVENAAEGKLPKQNIWVNVLHAVDGAWGINSEALTNDQIKDAISNG